MEVKSLLRSIAKIEELSSILKAQGIELQVLLKIDQPKRPDMEALRGMWEAWRDNAAYLTIEEKTELLALLVGKVTLTGHTEDGITAQVSLLLTDAAEMKTEPVAEQPAPTLQIPRSNVEDLKGLSARKPDSSTFAGIHFPTVKRRAFCNPAGVDLITVVAPFRRDAKTLGKALSFDHAAPG